MTLFPRDGAIGGSLNEILSDGSKRFRNDKGRQETGKGSKRVVEHWMIIFNTDQNAKTPNPTGFENTAILDYNNYRNTARTIVQYRTANPNVPLLLIYIFQKLVDFTLLVYRNGITAWLSPKMVQIAM